MSTDLLCKFLIVLLSTVLLAVLCYNNYADIRGIFLSRSLRNMSFRLFNYEQNLEGYAVLIEKNYALTARHNAKKDSEVFITVNHKEVKGYVVDEDIKQDVSLIKLDNAVDMYTCIDYRIPEDKKVYMYLHDRGYVKGKIIYNFSDAEGNNFYIADIGGEKGYSGAGVFNNRGFLLSLVSKILDSKELNKKYIVFASPDEFNGVIQRWQESGIIS